MGAYSRGEEPALPKGEGNGSRDLSPLPPGKSQPSSKVLRGLERAGGDWQDRNSSVTSPQLWTEGQLSQSPWVASQPHRDPEAIHQRAELAYQQVV